MATKGNSQLEKLLEGVLYDADPMLQQDQQFVKEFAARLAEFTETWATDPGMVDTAEREIEQWIDDAPRK